MSPVWLRALSGRLGPRGRAFVVRVIWFVLGFVFALWCSYDIAARSASEAVGPARDWWGKEGDTFLFVAILSSHKTEHLRHAARRTWLKLAAASEQRIVYKFFVGAHGTPLQWVENLKRESLSFDDVVILDDAEDSYEHLTSKLVHSLKWIVGHYYFDFVLKLDDDSFARVDVVADELAKWKEERPDGELYWGYFAGNAPVFKSGKWAERTWYLRDGYYLPYARGGGYVLPQSAARYIATLAFVAFDYYFSEDASVGVWTAPLRLHRKHDRRFDTEYRSRGCFNSYLVTHKQTATMMYEKYRNLEQTGVMCQREVRSRLSYEYNWSAPPSKCCMRNVTDATLSRRPRFHWHHNQL
ncbi:beta-1,3-galactosyltransferase 6-like [Dermacentor andersoni]|uniref:beta-1,3-galactosyltransferase 6-like n=1 Tax=Dermacentor andersoni TaxID=34620 RepID=UPI0021553EF5|nr:beta-1,3-galactosyltransferase 6-like [Dermacentor andersoni]